MVIFELSGTFLSFYIYVYAGPCSVAPSRKGGSVHSTLLQRFCIFLTVERGISLSKAVWDGLGGFSGFCFEELRISPISIIWYLFNCLAHFPLCDSVCALCSLDGSCSYRGHWCSSLNEEKALLSREVLNTHLEAADECTTPYSDDKPGK